MLHTLHIRDFVIVDDIELHFNAGFTVFSGETGAGKSILFDALALALGGKGDASLVRHGAARTDVTAIFDTPGSLLPWLEENALEADDNLVLRRTLDTHGRSRAFINGQSVPVTQLRALADFLVDIHGQHAHQSLLKAASQRELLDAHGRHFPLVEQLQGAWKQWQAALVALRSAQENSEAQELEREQLAWQANELDQLALQADEWETISTEHQRLAHAQALLEGATGALSLLDNDDSVSARRQLNAATQHLQKILAHDPLLQPILESLESARISLAEAVSDLNSYLDKIELDPDRLAQAEQRMSAIFDTARKFRCEPTDLPALHDSLTRRLAALQSASNLHELQAAEQKAHNAYLMLAGKLSQARREAGVRLSGDVTQAMQTLAMQGGSFQVDITPAEPGPFGTDAVQFLVAGHPGTPLRPLAKVASGGELARISLAISVIASQAARVPTLLFDEVDAGIGGGVAEVVGRLLQELGERHQVLCVTHLPQVAARGNHHYQVSKQASDNGTVSRIQALDLDARAQEIARMLGGLTITETTRRHAREMLG
ncbi:MAG: DNA repair protein RecN [Burkholderiaceae bacterium]